MMGCIEGNTVPRQPSPVSATGKLLKWVRLTSPLPERRTTSPEERAQVAKWLELADVALDVRQQKLG